MLHLHHTIFTCYSENFYFVPFNIVWKYAIISVILICCSFSPTLHYYYLIEIPIIMIDSNIFITEAELCCLGK